MSRQIADLSTSLATGKMTGPTGSNAASVAISTRLTSSIIAAQQAKKNANDAQSLLSTADQAYGDVISYLQRIRELAVQASNDTNSTADRASLDQEAQSLLDGINQIANNTSWAGQNLLDGSFTDKLFAVNAGVGNSGQLGVSIGGATTGALGLGNAPETTSTSYQVTRVSTVTTTPPGSATTTTTVTSESTPPITGSSTVSTVATVSTATAPTKIGTEFIVSAVSSPTSGSGWYSRIAALQGERFVIVYGSIPALSISAQFYDASGNKIGNEFEIATKPNQDGTTITPSSICPLSNGGFAVTWYSNYGEGTGRDVFGQIIDSAGNKIGAVFKLNTSTIGDQGKPSIAATPSGFVAAWESIGQDGMVYIYGQKFDLGGQKIGSEFNIPSYTYASQKTSPSISSYSNGEFVVTWSSRFQGIFAQRFDSAGNKIGAEFQVSTNPGSKDASYVATLSGGGFVVSWTSYGQDGDRDGIFGQRFDQSGNKVGGEFQVNTYTVMDQWNSSIVALADGGFVINWDGYSNFSPSAYIDVFSQRYDSSGQKIGGNLIVNTTINGAQFQVSNGAIINGNLMLSWQSGQRYSSSYDVWAQVLSTTEQVTTTTLTDTSYTTAVISTPATSSLVDLTTFSAAQSSLNLIDGALVKAAGTRSRLDAITTSLNFSMDVNQNAVTNLTQSRSRIEDTDYGQQIAALTKAQIIQQASMAMLAQANASKQSILMLLKSAA